MVVLGCVNVNDFIDYGNFNGILKIVNVKLDLELIINFIIM